jgi:hypothetical protein
MSRGERGPHHVMLGRPQGVHSGVRHGADSFIVEAERE